MSEKIMAWNTPQSAIKLIAMLLACFLSACATDSNTPATVHTNQLTQTKFNIYSKEVDANINGVKYFGFYIFNSCKDVMKQSTCAVGEASKSTNIASSTQKLSKDLLIAAGTLDADGNYNANSPGLVAMRKRLAANDAFEKSIQAAHHKLDDNIFSAIGEGRFTEFMRNQITDTPDKDIRNAKEALDEETYYSDYYNDRYNLVSVGSAQINYATSKLNTVDATKTKLLISLPLLAQASQKEISYPKDYNIDEAADYTSRLIQSLYGVNTQQVTINSNFGDPVECEIYMGGAIRKVGACVSSNGDTYIISSHFRHPSH